jgi:hypothetical protein
MTGDAARARSPSRKHKDKEEKKRKRSGKEEKKRKHGRKDKDKDKHRKRRAASHSGASSSSGGSSSDSGGGGGGGRTETPARELARLREACAQLRDVLRAFPQVPRKDVRTLLWSVDAGQGVDLSGIPGACACCPQRARARPAIYVAPRRATEHAHVCVCACVIRVRCGAAHCAGAPV